MKPTPPLGSNPQDTASGPMHIDWIRWFESLKTAVENLSTQTYAPVTPSALTRANDTNVTVTLTGSPTVALLAPVLMTMGWTGVLAVSRGGTGTGTAFTAGSVIFAGPSGVYAQDNANLFWDDTNNRLGIGTAAPGQQLDVSNAGTATIRVIDTAISGSALLQAATGVVSASTVGSRVVLIYGEAGGKQWSITSGGRTAAGYLSFVDDTDALIVQTMTNTGNVGIGQTTPTAVLHLKAGTTAASTAPIKLASGSLLTTPEVGAIEFLTNAFYGTGTTGPTRKAFAMLENGAGAALTTGSVVFAGATGALSQDNANFFWDDTNNRLGIGTAAPSFILDILPTSIVNNGVGIAVSPATTTVATWNAFRATGSITGNFEILLQNSAVAANAHARYMIQIDDAAGGDPYALFRISGATDWSFGTDNSDSDKFIISQASTLGSNNRLVIQTDGNTGHGVNTPTAVVHIKAGTTAASTAPLKFNSGSLQTTAEAGAVEFLTDGFYATITTGAARKGIVLDDGTALTSGRVPFATTNGRLTDDADLTFATDTLTATKVSAPTSVSTGTLAQTGKTTTYNNVVTAGWGEPAIYASARSTAQVAAVASVAAYTCGAADGSFLVSTNVNVTTSTAHNFTVAVDYTDETNTARTLTLPVVQLAGTVITAITNLTGAGPYEGIATQIRCKASTAITIKTVGTFTTVTYNVEGLIQQVA